MTTSDLIGLEGEQLKPSPKAGKATRAEKAKEGEERACKHISSLGYRIVKRNFRFGRVGEIDIVAYDAGKNPFRL